MATHAITRSSLTCLGCLRGSTLPSPVSLSTTTLQVRGKKNYHPKGSMRDGMVVKLQCNIKGYGPKGSLMRVARGRYRNIWSPRRLATMVAPSEFKKLGLREEDIVPRDPNFGEVVHVDKADLQRQLKDAEMKSTGGKGLESILGVAASGANAFLVPKKDKSAAEDATGAKALTPDETVSLLLAVAPAEFIFARKLRQEQKLVLKKSSQPEPTPSPTPEPTPEPALAPAPTRNPLLSRHAASVSIQAETAAIDEAWSTSPSPSPSTPVSTKPSSEPELDPAAQKEKPIFGSVTVTDVLSSLRTSLSLSDDPNARNVRLTAADLHFVGLPAGEGKEQNIKVQNTGEFVVEISVAGSDAKVVQKVIRVVGDDNAKPGPESSVAGPDGPKGKGGVGGSGGSGGPTITKVYGTNQPQEDKKRGRGDKDDGGGVIRRINSASRPEGQPREGPP